VAEAAVDEGLAEAYVDFDVGAAADADAGFAEAAPLEAGLDEVDAGFVAVVAAADSLFGGLPLRFFRAGSPSSGADFS
jgi:hypothetical protein